MCHLHDSLGLQRFTGTGAALMTEALAQIAFPKLARSQTELGDLMKYKFLGHIPKPTESESLGQRNGILTNASERLMALPVSRGMEHLNT